MSEQREPKHITVHSPDAGTKFIEQVRNGDLVQYAEYQPGAGAVPERIRYRMTVEEEQENGDIKIYKPLKRPYWPLPGNPEEPGKLETDIGRYLADHIYLERPEHYALLSAWVKLTYVAELTETFPYLYFVGPKESGKTRALETLHQLARRGVLTPILNEAPLFRLNELYHVSFFLDESEVYSREDRSTIQNLLNSGYRRGQFVYRVNKNNPDEIQSFDVYGAKALAGLGMFRETLESRCLIIPMEKYRGPLRYRIDTKTGEQLRGRLLTWRWRTLGQLDNSDNSDNYCIASQITGRVRELLEPLLRFAGPEERTLIEEYALQVNREKLEDELASEEAELVRIVQGQQQDTEDGRMGKLVLRIALIRDAFNAARDQKEHVHTNTIRAILRRLGFQRARAADGSRCIHYDEKLIDRLASRYETVETLGSTPVIVNTVRTVQLSGREKLLAFLPNLDKEVDKS